jgi:general secretion pathway protein A
MYKAFFGLSRNPFNANPDPDYLYLTQQMKESLEELTYGIEVRKGCMLLTGEVGTGKTTIVNYLLSWLRQRKARTAFIFNSHLNTSQLFEFILADFGLADDPRFKTNPLMAFNEWLTERYRAHEMVVLIVDEAQGLPASSLEEIRLLMNLEMPHEKMLQIVLCGQPELEAKLKRPELRQLQQRIGVRCKTRALTLQETYDYIQNRLRIAGAVGAPLFSQEAIDAVHFHGRGIPRIMNLICENALINGYVEQVRLIGASLVEGAARDLELEAISAPRGHRSLDVSGESRGRETNSADAPARHEGPAHRVGREECNNPPPIAAKAFAAAASASGPVARTFPEYSSEIAAFNISPATVRDEVRDTPKVVTQVINAHRASVEPVRPNAAQKVTRQQLARRRWMARFAAEKYWKISATSGLAGVALFTLSQKVNAMDPWEHAVQMLGGYFGLLLCAISIGFAITIAVQHAGRSSSRWAARKVAALRWLRQPMGHFELRERSSVAGDVRQSLSQKRV